MAQLPAPEEILEFIKSAEKLGEPAPARREIAKAFGIKGPDRAALRGMLKKMEADGLLSLHGRRAEATHEGLPPVLVLDITETDENGDLVCAQGAGKPVEPAPRIILTDRAAQKLKPPLGVGDRFLGRVNAGTEGVYLAKPIKALGKGATRVLGVFRKTRRGGLVEPVDRKSGSAFEVSATDIGDAADGDLVWAEVQHRRGYGPHRARIREVMGDIGASKNWSLIALVQNDIPTEFPQAVIDEAEKAKIGDTSQYEDIRTLPLITIDPADAKDHDDAVFAAPDGEGWRIIVAIADVSYFVRPGGALDREAERRGNSVYLVDRVVPMLPEVLSNGLCSLKAGEDRLALCCEMFISAEGAIKKHRFFRGLMKSSAGLSYEEAQAAANGALTDRTRHLKDDVIDPLFAAYGAMRRGLERRSPLALDMPERKIILDADGQVDSVQTKDRFDAHKLIEAMMVAANVCAAEALEKKKRPLIYRVHDAPAPERVEALSLYLETLGYSLPKGQVLKPIAFNRILEKAEAKDEVDLVSLAILRTQAQAIYDTDNLGHFGLNLTRYAHFTSPIRRYADLTVHRALVDAFRLGPGGAAHDKISLQKTAEHISTTERRAVSAERATQDRFLAAYLEKQIGAVFAAKVSGVTHAGLFVQLDETGADGFVPARSLIGDYYRYEEENQRLVGQHSGGIYAIGQRVQVELQEVVPVQGGLRFEMLSEPLDGETKSGRPKKPQRGPVKGADRKNAKSAPSRHRGKPTAKKGSNREPDGPAPSDTKLKRRPRRPKT